MKTKKYEIMTHIVAGYPSIQESKDIALAMIESGIDRLEIQIPFSDPVADGPVIAKANIESLNSGTCIADCMQLMKFIREKTDIPLYFMTYYNIPFVYGLDEFCTQAKEAGATGFIIPDIPFDEEKNNQYLATCDKFGLNSISVLCSATPENRIKKIAEISRDFIYCVSGTGTTGDKRTFGEKNREFLDYVRTFTDKPLALGFGISSPEDIKKVGKMADIVVIGSQLIREYNEGGLAKIREFLG